MIANESTADREVEAEGSSEELDADMRAEALASISSRFAATKHSSAGI